MSKARKSGVRGRDGVGSRGGVGGAVGGGEPKPQASQVGAGLILIPRPQIPE